MVDGQEQHHLSQGEQGDEAQRAQMPRERKAQVEGQAQHERHEDGVHGGVLVAASQAERQVDQARRAEGPQGAEELEGAQGLVGETAHPGIGELAGDEAVGEEREELEDVAAPARHLVVERGLAGRLAGLPFGPLIAPCVWAGEARGAGHGGEEAERHGGHRKQGVAHDVCVHEPQERLDAACGRKARDEGDEHFALAHHDEPACPRADEQALAHTQGRQAGKVGAILGEGQLDTQADGLERCPACGARPARARSAPVPENPAERGKREQGKGPACGKQVLGRLGGAYRVEKHELVRVAHAEARGQAQAPQDETGLLQHLAYGQACHVRSLPWGPLSRAGRRRLCGDDCGNRLYMMPR